MKLQVTKKVLIHTVTGTVQCIMPFLFITSKKYYAVFYFTVVFMNNLGTQLRMKIIFSKDWPLKVD